MRIFFITPKLNFTTAGGTTDEYDLTYRTLRDMGEDVSVVTVFSEANNIDRELPYTVFKETNVSGRQMGIQKGVYKILKKYQGQADVFFIDGQVFLYGAGFYRKRGGNVPIVAYFNRELTAWPENISRFFPHKKDNFVKKLKKAARLYVERHFFMPLANHVDVFCFSNSHLQESYKNFGMDTEGRSFIFGDPFDYRDRMKKYGVTEDSYINRNKESGPYNLFYSSRMAPGKGFDLVLTAFSKIKNKENFRLILGGTGPEEPLVHKMVKDLNLEKYVELPGWMTKEELYRRFGEADIFVHAYWRPDITAMSLMTALMFGLPSIVPRGGGLEWVARESALYFEDYNADDLASKIQLLADDRSLRAKLSKECYVRIDHPEMNHLSRITLLRDKMRQIIHK